MRIVARTARCEKIENRHLPAREVVFALWYASCGLPLAGMQKRVFF
jgi:hypothetical protein